MTFWQGVLVALAGAAAGAVNAAVGSGTLLTFPVLLSIGLPPVSANVTNALGLVPGSAMGAWAYRPELAGQRERIVRLGSAAVVGGAAGAALLLSLPARAFSTVAPYLVGIAVLLVLFGPRLTDALRHTGHQAGTRVSPALWLLIAGAAVYGGYFGPAMSMILMGVMGVFVQESLQRLNGLKNLLAALVNGVAASVFLFTGSMDFAAAGLLAVGATAGGLLGAKVAKRLPPAALRALIVVVGILALIKLIA